MKILVLVYQHLQGNWSSFVWSVDSVLRKWIDPKTRWLQDKVAPWASTLCLSQSGLKVPSSRKCWSPEPQAPHHPLQHPQRTVHTWWDIHMFTWFFHSLHCNSAIKRNDNSFKLVQINRKVYYKIRHVNKENGTFPPLTKLHGKLWWRCWRGHK